MKRSFYPRLAIDGMRKNRRMYGPYLAMGVLMAAICYILSALSRSDALRTLPGGDNLCMIMALGNVVLLTREELASIFLRQLSPFPIQGRMDEMKKYLRRRLKDASERMKQQLDKLAQNRLDELLRRLTSEGMGCMLLPSRYVGLLGGEGYQPAYYMIPPKYRAWWALSVVRLREAYLSRAAEAFLASFKAHLTEDEL